MGKVVVFGGHGFVGKYLCKLLGQHVAPTALEVDLSQTTLVTYNAIEELVEDGDSIVMLAGYTNEYGNPNRLTAENIAMAANLLWGISGKEISHFVYMSSDSVYGKKEPLDRVLVDEAVPLCADSLYAGMHILRERYFMEYFPPEKLTILRPSAIYGSGDTHNAYGINSFVKEAKEKGEVTLFGDGEEYRSCVHVADVAAIIAQALEGKVAGVFNVNCGTSWTFKQVAQCIQRNIGKEIQILSKPRTVPVTHRYFNNNALASAFFQPRLLEDGVKEYLACI